jgi:hypothetical protein
LAPIILGTKRGTEAADVLRKQDVVGEHSIDIEGAARAVLELMETQM